MRSVMINIMCGEEWDNYLSYCMNGDTAVNTADTGRLPRVPIYMITIKLDQ